MRPAWTAGALARCATAASWRTPLPVTDDTLFQLGSITKTFTGTVVMRLVEAGKLRLDAPPVPPPPPPVPYAFYAKDRLIGVQGSTKGEHVEFLRLPDGSVEWVRVRGRVARRVGKSGM